MRGLSIRAKVLLVVSLSLIGIFACITWLLVSQNTKQLKGNLNEQSKSFASLAAKPIGDTFVLYKDSGSLKITQQVNNFLALDADVTDIKVVSVTGDQLFGSSSHSGPGITEKLASSFTPQYIKDPHGYVTTVIQPYFEDSGAHRYSIVYDISTARIENSVREVVRLILYAGIAILALSIAVTGMMLNLFFIRPLRAVSQSANIISSGNLDHQIESGSHDEIGDLAAAVNKMADNLKADIVKLTELDKLKSEFMMITSHNLRTPITIMRGYVEMAETAESVEELKKIVTTIDESLVRLHLLAEDVLAISTLESGKLQLVTSPTDMKQFVDSVTDDFELLASKKRLSWEYDNSILEGTKLKASSTHLRSAFANLLDNAIKFTPEGGNVAVNAGLSPDKQTINFTVQDSGIGIRAEEIPKLFTKFHRGTSTMTYDYEGLGIGLYLTKLIAEQHGGKVTVESHEGKGSTFTISLPLAPLAA